MAGHLAAQKAVCAGAPPPPRRHSPPAHAVLPLPLCSAGPAGAGSRVGGGVPVPSQISGPHLGPLECVGPASGPRIQHGPGGAGVRRSVIRETRTRPGGL